MDYELCYCNGEDISEINKFIYFVSVVPFTIFCSFILSSIFVEKYIWRPQIKKSLNDCIDVIEEEKVEKEIYTDKYKLETNQDEPIHDDNYYKNICVIENTPNGNVIMEYNKKDEVWFYYADKKYKNNISFDYLDTICRKFCKTYNCSKLYIDRKHDIEQQQKDSLEKKKLEKEKKLEKGPDDDLFIKPKLSTNKSMKSKKISANKSNKYKYKGELKDFWAFNIKYEKKSEVKQDTSWSLWKKSNSN